MPNHVTTRLTASPEAIKALLNDKDEVDFSRIVPPPDHPDYNTNECGHQHPLRGNDPNPNCWYVWQINNWGTKWNAYDTSEIEGGAGDQATVQFDTAWSHPYPVIVALAEQFPGRFEVKYADEDLGQNIGHYIIDRETDIVSVMPFEEGSDEAREFAAQMKYGMTYAELTEDEED